MALIFIDSFDHYATADLATKWTSVLDAPAVGAYGRRSSSGLRCTRAANAAEGLYVGFPAKGTIITGFAMKADLAYVAAIYAVFDGPADQSHVFLRLNADGSLTAYRAGGGSGSTAPGATLGATVLASSAGGVVQAGVWHYMECRVYIDDASGTVTVHVDGVEVLTFTGDTKYGANATATSIFLGISEPAGAVTIDFDDVYVCDSAGGVNDDFLGDVRVDAHLPSGAGTTTQWDPSAGANYTCVDESAPNGDTDYVSTDVTDDVDLYAFPNLANAGGTIYGLQVLASCKKTDEGTCSLAPVVRPTSTNYIGDTFAVGTSYAYHLRQCYDTSPEGGSPAEAFTEAEFNGCEFGIKKIA